MAAVLEDALFEEWRELTDGVFGEMKTAVCVCSERRAGGRQHHPEQVPQITLQVIPAFGDHSLVSVSKQFLGRELESCQLWILEFEALVHFPEATVTSEHSPRLIHHSDLHLELKVLVLPLPAENVTRNANFDGILKAVGARHKRASNQVLIFMPPWINVLQLFIIPERFTGQRQIQVAAAIEKIHLA